MVYFLQNYKLYSYLKFKIIFSDFMVIVLKLFYSYYLYVYWCKKFVKFVSIRNFDVQNYIVDNI